MNNTSSRFLPIGVKLALSFVFLAVLSVGVSSYIYYQNSRAQLIEDIRERLRVSVAIAALQVDAEKHATLTDPSQEGNETYVELKKNLQNIRDSATRIEGPGTKIEFVYTMRPDDEGRIVFIVDAEESEEDISHLGDIYEEAEAGSVLAENFLTMSIPMVEEEIYTDQWGAHLSGYAPFYAPDGRREGVLGIDISADDITKQERVILLRAWGIFGGSTVVSILLGLILGFLLARPIGILTMGARKLASGELTHRIVLNTRDETETLAEAFNATADKLNALVAGLEKRVEERTQALTRRTAQLRAATQVAHQSTAIKDPAALLNEAVKLVSDQFGFYHAGIFLLDESNEYAVLQAASSEGGQRMLARGHRLRVGSQGIVGFAAAQKRPRIALDIGTDAVYFDNPDLPATRSEAALPLIVRDRVIGVLDIQSEQPQAFTQEDIETFQSMANQLSLAIENARLFGEMDASVRELERTAAQRVRQAWNEVAKTKTSAVQYTPLGIQVIHGKTAAPADPQILEVPISLHNKKIGAIRVKHKREKSNWSEREQEMLTEVATQVGLALENARLLNEAQRRAASERAIGEIIARIGAAFDVDSILRVTAQEVGKAISDAEVSVQIRGEDGANA